MNHLSIELDDVCIANSLTFRKLSFLYVVILYNQGAQMNYLGT